MSAQECAAIIDYKQKPDREKVAALIEDHDQGRFAWHGGYPSEWEIKNDEVIWADVDHDGAPRLLIKPIKEFIAEYEGDYLERLEEQGDAR